MLGNFAYFYRLQIFKKINVCIKYFGNAIRVSSSSKAVKLNVGFNYPGSDCL